MGVQDRVKIPHIIRHLDYYLDFLKKLWKEYREQLIVTLTICVVILFTKYHPIYRVFPPDVPRILIRMVYQPLLFLIGPIFTFILIGKGFREFGFIPKKIKFWWRDFLLFYFVMLVLVILVCRTRTFQYTYPLFKHAEKSFKPFIMWEMVHLFYMFGWEFLWRGYLLFSIRRKAGDVIAVLIQTIPFALLHVGKPELEAYGSIIAGIFLGVLAIKSNSFIPGAILHFLVALTMDVLAVMF